QDWNESGGDYHGRKHHHGRKEKDWRGIRNRQILLAKQLQQVCVWTENTGALPPLYACLESGDDAAQGWRGQHQDQQLHQTHGQLHWENLRYKSKESSMKKI